MKRLFAALLIVGLGSLSQLVADCDPYRTGADQFWSGYTYNPAGYGCGGAWNITGCSFGCRKDKADANHLPCKFQHSYEIKFYDTKASPPQYIHESGDLSAFADYFQLDCNGATKAYTCSHGINCLHGAPAEYQFTHRERGVSGATIDVYADWVNMTTYH